MVDVVGKSGMVEGADVAVAAVAAAMVVMVVMLVVVKMLRNSKGDAIVEVRDFPCFPAYS